MGRCMIYVGSWISDATCIWTNHSLRAIAFVARVSICSGKTALTVKVDASFELWIAKRCEICRVVAAIILVPLAAVFASVSQV